MGASRRRLEGAARLTAMAASSPVWFFASVELQLASVGPDHDEHGAALVATAVERWSGPRSRDQGGTRPRDRVRRLTSMSRDRRMAR